MVVSNSLTSLDYPTYLYQIACCTLICGRLLAAGHEWSYQEVYNISAERDMWELPQVHGIPKVHKKSWTLRPIVLTHSWFSANLAKIVTLVLKPGYSAFPWIIQPTR